jgi:hypothetical protein
MNCVTRSVGFWPWAHVRVNRAIPKTRRSLRSPPEMNCRPISALAADGLTSWYASATGRSSQNL